MRSRVLCLVNGAFSERFFQIARACGVEAEALTVPLGQIHTPEMLEAALKGGKFDAVTVVHSETSTGALNPIAELTRVAHDAGDVAMLVDSVSGMAGAPVETDAWELDFVLTGSQKAFAIPAGLAFAAARDNVIERAKAKTGSRHLLRPHRVRQVDSKEPDTEHAGAVAVLRAGCAAWPTFAARRSKATMGASRRNGPTHLGRGSMRFATQEFRFPFSRHEGARSPTVTCVCAPANAHRKRRHVGDEGSRIRRSRQATVR